MKGLIGKKVGMTQVYDEKGVLIPVTVIQAGPCVVTAVKTVERDGYSAVQLGFGERKAKNVTKARIGHLAKAGVSGEKLPSVLREIRLAGGDEAPAPGTTLKADTFEANEYLDVIGTTKGRGFQGVVRRYRFGGGRASHGGVWTRFDRVLRMARKRDQGQAHAGSHGQRFADDSESADRPGDGG